MRLGVDLGGTDTKLALVADGGAIAKSARFPTRVRDGVPAWVSRLAEAARALGPFDAAGVAVPGVLNRAEGAVVASPNLHAWDRFPLLASLREALGVPVVLENDANAAAVGEARFGAGRRWPDFLLATVGTGVGGGLVLGGELVIGPGGMAGEAGHLLAELPGRPCGCGLRGCVETAASITGMIASAREAGESLGIDPPRDGRELASWLAGDDPARRAIAREAFDRAGRALGSGFGTVVTLLDVRRFLVGGGGAGSLAELLPGIREGLAARVYGRPLDSIEIAAAALGNDAGALGAAWLAGRS